MTAFPFVGAGEARYFEWAEVHVRFARAPKPAERARIAADVPGPLRDSVDFTGSHLAVASAQGVGRYIEATYGRNKLTKLTTASRFKASSKVARFNADIERWLHAAHAIVPIRIAYRRQDWEAGGTELSDWHRDSLAAADAISRALTAPAEKHMRDGIRAELAAAAKTGPSPDEQADGVIRAYLNIRNDKGALARAKAAVAALDGERAWWIAADEVADSGIACHRDDRLLAHRGARDLALAVFRRALAGTSAADHRRGFQFRIDDGYQAWRLPRIIAVALEAAVRAGDAKAFAHFKRGLDRTSRSQRDELVRCADALDTDALPKLAAKLRALASG